jgi:hypothetical protein
LFIQKVRFPIHEVLAILPTDFSQSIKPEIRNFLVDKFNGALYSPMFLIVTGSDDAEIVVVCDIHNSPLL